MSVMTLEIKTFEAIYNKAISYTFRKECDINYNSTLSRFTETQLQDIVKKWCYLNELSFNVRYADDELPTMSDFITFKRNKSIDTYQMLKSLECLRYNIEIDTVNKVGTPDARNIDTTIRNGTDVMKVLDRAIEEIKSTIINIIPEYMNAKWGSI